MKNLPRNGIFWHILDVFEDYSILAEKQRLKPKNSNSLKFFASFDTLLDPRCAKVVEINFTSKIASVEMILRANTPVWIIDLAITLCTIELGNPNLERYVRICHLCQLRYNSWLSEKTFGFLIAFVTVFPICFYMPRFFEMRSKEDIKLIFTGLDILYRHLNNRQYKIAKWGPDTDSLYKT